MNRQERHIYFDGAGWNVYTERAADIRLYTKKLGPPTRLGRGGVVAHWVGLGPKALRVAFPRVRSQKPVDPGVAAARREALAKARAARKSGG